MGVNRRSSVMIGQRWKGLILAGLMAALMTPALAAPKGIAWQEDLEKGLALAKKQNKPALLNFYADWCSWCERMEEDTLSDPRVIELAKRFVTIKLNTEDKRRLQIHYKVRSLPTFVIYDPSGKEIGRVTGYRPATSFVEELQMALRQLKPGGSR
jgi:thiol:disulfide interchange protein